MRKYKYKPASPRPVAVFTAPEQSADPDRPLSAASPEENLSLNMDTSVLKADIIEALRKDIATVLREELKNALADDFNSLRSEMQAIKSEITSSNSAFRSEMDTVKSTLQDVGEGLSTWSDEVTTLQTTVKGLGKQLETLSKKSLDMESRMRRGNVRIANVVEKPGSSSPEAVSKLLKELFQLKRDIRVDRSHRSLIQPRPSKPGDSRPPPPRVIIAKLHNEGDAEEILKLARDGRKLKYQERNVAVFPDFPEAIAKARSAFTPARLLLKNRRDVRYGIKFPSTFVVTHNEEEKEFLDADEALRYAKSITASPSTTQENEPNAPP